MIYIEEDSVNVSVPVVLVNSTTGLAATGLTITDLDLQYTRIGSTPAAKVDATALAATNTAHTDNYAIELDATDQPGAYRVDWPDAAFATGASRVLLTVKHASCHPAHIWVELEAIPANVTEVNGVAASGSGTPDVNVVSVSGDTTAADTLELFVEALDQATGQLDSGSLASGTITAASLAADAITAAKVAADVGAEIADAVWDEALAGHVGVGSASESLTLVGTINENLGTPVGADFSADIDSIKADTVAILIDTGTTLDARIPAALVGGRMDCSVGAMAANVITASALNTDAVAEFWTTALTESYAAEGATLTGAQALYQLISIGGDFAISGTTISCKKLDGTEALTYTTDDATNPTSRTRAT